MWGQRSAPDTTVPVLTLASLLFSTNIFSFNIIFYIYHIYLSVDQLSKREPTQSWAARNLLKKHVGLGNTLVLLPRRGLKHEHDGNEEDHNARDREQSQPESDPAASLNAPGHTALLLRPADVICSSNSVFMACRQLSVKNFLK